MIVKYYMNSTVLAKLKQDVGDGQFGPMSKIVVDEALTDDQYVIELGSGTKRTMNVPTSPSLEKVIDNLDFVLRFV